MLFVVFKLAGAPAWFLAILRMARVSAGELFAMMECGEELVVLNARPDVAHELDRRRIPTARAVNLTSSAKALEGIDSIATLSSITGIRTKRARHVAPAHLIYQGYQKYGRWATDSRHGVPAGFSVVYRRTESKTTAE